MKSKEEKEYEERVKRRVQILKEQLENGNIHISEHLADDFEKSLLRVRLDKNGEPDLDTVDGRIRSMAL
ncbi:MAG: hypothetical protein V7691_16140, partial [Galbibacter orientalis]|uniref:hypothetical protein n=1 Tax=Galbibacter orientalis TaxID=453852 RepID=UPI003001ACC8